MSAYLFANIEIANPDLYREYSLRSPATVALYGGRFLARGGATRVLEGTVPPQRRVVIVEFPDLARLRAWHESAEYKPLRKMRDQAAQSSLWEIDGL